MPRILNLSAITRRGMRWVRVTISGRDAYGEPVTEITQMQMHWRKHKRLYGRKAGRNARYGH